MEKENNIYVGNLPWSVDEQKLTDLFNGVEGVEVVKSTIIREKFSGEDRSKGFGFVTVKDQNMIDIAAKALNGQTVDNRPIVVNEAREKKAHDSNSHSNRY